MMSDVPKSVWFRRRLSEGLAPRHTKNAGKDARRHSGRARATKTSGKDSLRLWLVALSLLLVFAVATNAQSFRGIILGTVTDSTGAAVSGANVTVKNLATGLTRVVTTRGDGT